MVRRLSQLLVVCAAALAVVVVVPSSAGASATGGTSYEPPAPKTTKAHRTTASTATPPATAVPTATVGPDGLAVAPAGAPPAVAALIAAGNQIAALPYRYGGGHGSFTDTAYDCSGSVSFALHGAGLLDATLDSTALERWGRTGAGTWLTVYANKTHTYLVVAGLRFDTSGRAKAHTRWQAAPRGAHGYKARHWAGL